MKKYNIQNYNRYKKDVKKSINRLEGKFWGEYTRDELIIKFLPLVENLARKFSTTQQASGVLSINDLIQEGSYGLIAAVDRLEQTILDDSDDLEKTLKSFLSKRIKGAIRRAIDINRGDIKIPEHKLLEIRKNNGTDNKMVRMFFNSVFSSIDEPSNEEEDQMMQIPDNSKDYNIDLLNTYLLGIMKTHLNEKEYDILRLSYGLDCDKHSAKEIANKLNIDVASGFVRVSQIKREAIEKLIANVPPEQVLDYL
jgi:RNA polymerase sigma factor (sigma-70 family)